MTGKMTEQALPLDLTFDPRFLSDDAYEHFDPRNPLYQFANDLREAHGALVAIFSPELETPYVNELYITLNGGRDAHQRFKAVIDRYSFNFGHLFKNVEHSTSLDVPPHLIFQLNEAVSSRTELFGELIQELAAIRDTHPKDEDLAWLIAALPYARSEMKDDLDRELGRSESYRVTDGIQPGSIYNITTLGDSNAKAATAKTLGRHSRELPASVRGMLASGDTVSIDVDDAGRSEGEVAADIRRALSESGEIDCQDLAQSQALLIEKSSINLTTVKQGLADIGLYDNRLANDIVAALVQGMGAWHFKLTSAMQAFLMELTDSMVTPQSEKPPHVTYDKKTQSVHIDFSSAMMVKLSQARGDRKLLSLSAGFTIDARTRKLTPDPISLNFESDCEQLDTIKQRLAVFGITPKPVYPKRAQKAAATCPSYRDFGPSTQTPSNVSAHFGVQPKGMWQGIKRRFNSAKNWVKANPTLAWTGLVAVTTFLLIGGISAALLASGVGTPLGIALTALSVDFAIGDMGLLILGSVALSSLSGGITFAAKKAQEASIKMKTFVDHCQAKQPIAYHMDVKPPVRVKQDPLLEQRAKLERTCSKLDSDYRTIRASLTNKPKPAKPRRSQTVPDFSRTFVVM